MTTDPRTQQVLDVAVGVANVLVSIAHWAFMDIARNPWLVPVTIAVALSLWGLGKLRVSGKLGLLLRSTVIYALLLCFVAPTDPSRDGALILDWLLGWIVLWIFWMGFRIWGGFL